MSTLPSCCSNKDAWRGIAKDLQELTVAQTVKNAGQSRGLASVPPAEEQRKCESGAALLACCGCAELCARTGHWGHHSSVLRGAMEAQPDRELVETNTQMLQIADGSLKLSFSDLKGMQTCCHPGKRVELR